MRSTVASGNRVVAARMERVAAGDAAERRARYRARHHGVRRFDAYSRAARREAARGAEIRRKRQLIAPDRSGEHHGGDSSPIRLDDSSSAALAARLPTEAAGAARSARPRAARSGQRRGTGTSDHDDVSTRRGGSPGCCRNHSRIRRFTRVRTTAGPTRRLAVMPSRGARVAAPASAGCATRTTNDASCACALARYALEIASFAEPVAAPEALASARASLPRRSRPPGACGPSHAGASEPHGRPGSSCVRGIRGCDGGGFGWADRCASSLDPVSLNGGP